MLPMLRNQRWHRLIAANQRLPGLHTDVNRRIVWFLVGFTRSDGIVDRFRDPLDFIIDDRSQNSCVLLLHLGLKFCHICIVLAIAVRAHKGCLLCLLLYLFIAVFIPAVFTEVTWRLWVPSDLDTLTAIFDVSFDRFRLDCYVLLWVIGVFSVGLRSFHLILLGDSYHLVFDAQDVFFEQGMLLETAVKERAHITGWLGSWCHEVHDEFQELFDFLTPRNHGSVHLLLECVYLLCLCLYNSGFLVYSLSYFLVTIKFKTDHTGVQVIDQ